MVSESELLSYFSDLEIPSNLIKLLNFEHTNAYDDNFSESFELDIDEAKEGLKTYSTDPRFLESLYEFARADASGSYYAFWLNDNNRDLSVAPIVIFGSEGGFHVVASYFNEFLQLLTFDNEPMVDWDNIYYYKDPETYQPSLKHQEYCDWLINELSITPIADANTIVDSAKQKYQQHFNVWIRQFYDV